MAIVLRKPTATVCPASHEVMVRYVESCDRGPMRAVAVRLGRADACKIPLAVIGCSGLDAVASPSRMSGVESISTVGHAMRYSDGSPYHFTN